jgi:hypothetical protein
MNKIAIVQVVKDLRRESCDNTVRQKYGLAPEAFRRLLQLLVSRGVVEHAELCRISDTYRSITAIVASRACPRIKVRTKIRVFDDASSQKGYLRDISENGIRVAGIDAVPGEILTLRLPLDEMPERSPLTFDGLCRWSKIKGKRSKYVVSGFEIVKIFDECAGRFEGLMEFCRSEAKINGQNGHVRFEELAQSCPGLESATKTRIFSGTLEGVDILDIVQLILLTGKQARLLIESIDGELGELYLDNGRVIHASQGGAGGEEAFFRCMNFSGGRFSTEPWSAPDECTIQSPGELLMMQAAQQRDESTDTGSCGDTTAVQVIIPEQSVN